MSHTITVTVAPTDDSDDYEWRIDGDHDRSCEVWYECTKASHRHPKNEFSDLEEWSTKRVPQHHQWLDGGWSTHRDGDCGYDDADHGEIYFALLERKAAIGDTFTVDIEWDEWFSVALGARVDTLPAGVYEPRDSGNGGTKNG